MLILAMTTISTMPLQAAIDKAQEEALYQTTIITRLIFTYMNNQKLHCAIYSNFLFKFDDETKTLNYQPIEKLNAEELQTIPNITDIIKQKLEDEIYKIKTRSHHLKA